MNFIRLKMSCSLLLVMIFICTAVTSFASGGIELTAGYYRDGTVLENDVSVGPDNLVVMGTALPNAHIMLSVLKPQEDFDTLADSNIKDKLFYADDAYADENGSFMFTFGFYSGMTGEYRIRVAGGDTGSYGETVLYIVNEDDRNSVIEAIHNSESVSDVEDVFVNSNAALNLEFDVSAFDRLESKGNVYKKIFEMNTTNAISLDNLAVYRKEFKKCSAFELYNQTRLGDDLRKHADDIGLNDSENVRSTLSLLTENAADSVYDLLGTKRYADAEELIKAYADMATLTAVKNTKWQSFNKIIGLNPSVFDNDGIYNKYLGLNDKSAVDMPMSGSSYSSPQDFELKFTSLVNTQYTIEHQGGSTPASPSPGGTPSSSVSVGGSVGGSNIKELEPIDYNGFTDIEGVPWAVEAIEYLQDMGIVTGTQKGVFSPEKIVTREEFVKMLVMVCNKYNEAQKSTFYDVPNTHWSASYIASAVKAGLVSGIDEHNFGLGQQISRQDACVLVARSLNDKKYKKTELKYTDSADISEYATDSIIAASSLGIVNGMDDKSFRPKESMTRAQAAKILYELSKVIGG